MTKYTLYGRPGWGSVLIEAQLDALGLPYDYREVPDLFKSDEGRRALAPLNPLSQVPTLVLPDGAVMTESAAITLHLADASGRDDFVPRPGHPARPQFLRWLVFLVANVYPTFTYADDPQRFVQDAGAAQAFDAAVGAYAERLWRAVEAAAGVPWFLGERFSALDVYIGTMTNWSPGRAWFEQNAPKLAAIADRALAEPRLMPAFRRNFPKRFGA
jgi:GST-like protein